MKPSKFTPIVCVALAWVGCDRTQPTEPARSSAATTTRGEEPGGGAGASGAAGAGGAHDFGPANGECAFDVTTSLSSAIATVGIVEWSTDLDPVDEAVIEFGLDDGYGSLAPVDLAAAKHHTLLLGMKPEREYHFRIRVRSADTVCVSDDRSLTTGARANGVPSFEVITENAARLSPGYLVTTLYSGSTALIVDNEGEVVWSFAGGTHLSSARMSFDAKYMWINESNVPEVDARVLRVSMDGLEVEDLSETFRGQNHQLAPLPDGSVAFYAYGDNGCDDVKEYHPERGVRQIINAADAHGGDGSCHLNVIEYSAADDTLVFSDLAHHNYTKVTRSGDVVWVLGGPNSDFSGDGARWTRQHGVHLLGLDRLLLFSNGAVGEVGATAVELALDLEARTAARVWDYTRAGLGTPILGDVQRMANGNTLVVYSGAGVVQEVTPGGELVHELRWDTGGALGYAMKRASLYGPPPK